MKDDNGLLNDKSEHFNYEMLKQKMKLAMLKKDLDEMEKKNKKLEIFVNKNNDFNTNNLQYNLLLSNTENLLKEQKLKNKYKNRYVSN